MSAARARLSVCGLAALGAMAALTALGAGCAHPQFGLSSEPARRRTGGPQEVVPGALAWTPRPIPGPDLDVRPAGGLPQTPVSAVVDRHVAVGPGRYELVARLGGAGGTASSSPASVRLRYTATWGRPVPVDAPSRVTLWGAPLDGREGERALGRVTLTRAGLRTSGMGGRALILRDARGVLLAALFQGTVGRRGRSAAPGSTPPWARTAPRGPLAATLAFRVSDHTDFSEVSRSEDLCLVTREHRSVDVRLGGGPWRRIPVGGALDVAPTAEPRAGTPSAVYRVTVLDAATVTTGATRCGGQEVGTLSLVIVRRGAVRSP